MSHVAPDVKLIFLEAIEKESPDERARYLDGACQGDANLRVRVEQLLQAHESAGKFLGGSATNDATVGLLRARGPSNPLLDSEPLVGTLEHVPAEKLGTRIGPYKLRELLGEGGMGNVFVAEQEVPVRRKVALKIIKPGMDSRQVLARFEAERQALALMDHPNIAKVLDAGAIESGRPYFVMELVRGVPITEFCDERRLDLRQRLELYIQVCRAIQHAHQKGIIHRDIKPSNILVTLHDDLAVPKVIDFGIAKATSQRLTEKTVYTAFNQMIGTPLYMSPEQAEMNALDVDTRSDVYSLGVLLYELLTGSTPFDRETLRRAGFDELRRLIREVDPPRPSQCVSTLNAEANSTVSRSRGADERHYSRKLRGDLDLIVMKALEKDRNRRYESASALAADVQRYLTDEPVQARPSSLVYRLRKLARRHQSRVAAAALISFLITVVIVIGVTMYAQRVSSRRQIVQQIQQSLASARTAVEAGDLTLAGQRVAEANGQLGEHHSSLSTMAADVDELAAEVNARRADQERYDRFMRLAQDGQQMVGKRYLQALEALGLYDILSDPKWLHRLNDSYLTPQQNRQVQETAYETVLVVAESHPAGEILEWLDCVRAFHEPTRAFWFLRRKAHRQQKDDQAAMEDDQHFLATEARTVWDHCIPGQDQEVKARIPFYQAALRIQPNHYYSLYGIGDCLAADEVNRLPEAIAYFTACIALRQDDVDAWVARAECQRKLGHLEEAEADYSASVDNANHCDDQFNAYARRYQFYQDVGRIDDAEQGWTHYITACEQVWKRLQSNTGPLDTETVKLMFPNLTRIYWEVGRLDEALELDRDVFHKFKAQFGLDDRWTHEAMSFLAESYSRAERLDEALEFQLELVRLTKAKFGPEFFNTAVYMRNLAEMYDRAQDFTKAESLYRTVFESHRTRLGPHHPQTLEVKALIGRTLLHQQRYSESELLLRECVAALETSQHHAWMTLPGIMKSHFGGALLGQAHELKAANAAAAETKLVEAEPLLLAGYAILKAREAKSHLYDSYEKIFLTQAIQRLVELYTEWEQPDEAAKWQQELAARNPKRLPAAHSQTATPKP